jgi:hypothetical protein
MLNSRHFEAEPMGIRNAAIRNAVRALPLFTLAALALLFLATPVHPVLASSGSLPSAHSRWPKIQLDAPEADGSATPTPAVITGP